MPKISVVLPSYNGERFLKKSIESVINQTFKDWELIIVNDCSVDNTRKIAAEYASKDSRIRLINNNINQKLPKSLNIGFREAVGEYFTWTSDDNIYLPEAFEKMVTYLDVHDDIPMVCADMETMDEEGNVIGLFTQYDEKLMLYNDCVGACFMYRKSVCSEVGEYAPEWFLVEDYEYWLRIYFKCGGIGHINEILYRYRYHKESLTGTRQNEIKKQLHQLRIKYIEQICNGLKDSIGLLGGVYAEMLQADSSGLGYKENICNVMPVFKIICPYKKNFSTAIFGAGDFGNRAFKKVGKDVVYYIDSNPEKIGTIMNERKVISLDEYCMQKNKIQLLVALSCEKQGEAIMQLYSKGIRKCSVYQNLENI